MLYTQIALARNINEKITSATYCAILHHGQLDVKKGRDNKLSDRRTRKDRRSRNNTALKDTYMCGQSINPVRKTSNFLRTQIRGYFFLKVNAHAMGKIMQFSVQEIPKLRDQGSIYISRVFEHNSTHQIR